VSIGRRRADAARIDGNRAIAQRGLREKLCVTLRHGRQRRTVEVHIISDFQQRPEITVFEVDGERHDGTTGWRAMFLDECFDMQLTDRASKAPRYDDRSGVPVSVFLEHEF
jgi:hypothetical protein